MDLESLLLDYPHLESAQFKRALSLCPRDDCSALGDKDSSGEPLTEPETSMFLYVSLSIQVSELPQNMEETVSKERS